MGEVLFLLPMNTDQNTVYISNLSYQSDRNGLKSMFAPFGVIKNIKIVVEPTTNQSRGMAFVEMGNPAQAKAAIEGLDGKVFSGRTVKARPAIPQRKVAARATTSKKNENKDLEFATVQMAKKARNEAKRKSNPLVMKYVPAKKA